MHLRFPPFALPATLLAFSLWGAVALTWHLSSPRAISTSPHLSKPSKAAEPRFAHAMQIMRQIDSDAASAHLTLPDQIGQWPALLSLVSQATTEWKSLTKDYPELPEPFSNLAVAYSKQGQYFLATDALLEGLQFHPQHPTLTENLKALDRFVLFLPSTHPARTIETQRIHQSVEKWRHGWASRDVNQYFASYSATFKPSNGLSLTEWKTQRKARVTAPSAIALTLSDVNVRLLSSHTAEVSFLQVYTADSKFLATQKRLKLVRDSGGWSIQSEEAL